MLNNISKLTDYKENYMKKKVGDEVFTQETPILVNTIILSLFVQPPPCTHIGEIITNTFRNDKTL